jgi:hypothetical protein
MRSLLAGLKVSPAFPGNGVDFNVLAELEDALVRLEYAEAGKAPLSKNNASKPKAAAVSLF